MAKDLNKAAAALGRKGGQAKVPKGFATMGDEEKRRIQSLGGQARWRGKAKKKGGKKK